jgi:hypothetical protein
MGKKKAVKPKVRTASERVLALPPTQPAPGDIFEDITEEGLLEVKLDDVAAATYVRIEPYPCPDDPGSTISEAIFSGLAGATQMQNMQVQPDPDLFGIFGAFSIYNRQLYYSNNPSGEGSYSFGAYTYEDYSFGDFDGTARLTALNTNVHTRRTNVIPSCIYCRSEGAMPIHLFLNAASLDPSKFPGAATGATVFGKIDLYHSRMSKTSCCWFSKPGSLMVGGVTTVVYWVLKKYEHKNWKVLLKSKGGLVSPGVDVHYDTKPPGGTSKTAFSGAGLNLSLADGSAASYPLTVTVTDH